MKRLFLLAIVSAILVSCSGSTAIQTPTWTPEAPRKVDVTIELPTVTTENAATATNEPTFTPIPATFTLEPTATNTLTPTVTSTAKPTATRPLPTRTLIPTVVVFPTNTPVVILPTNPPIVIQPTNPPSQVCCKVCTTGKACGDSCIAKNLTCHKGPGCACNG